MVETIRIYIPNIKQIYPTFLTDVKHLNRANILLTVNVVS